MLKLKSSAAVMALAAMAALGPLATDMYLPAMPAMADSLNATAGEVQLTLSVYLLGFAVTQLVCGPLSDSYGRKPVLLGGFGLFLFASAVCAMASGIEVLLVGRFLQALGGAVGPVLGRAMVRDIHEPEDAGRILSYMASVMALAPAAAPVIGGGLLVAFGWPSIFVLLTAYAVVMLVVIAWLWPEPLPVERRQSIHPGAILRNFRMLVVQRSFVGYTLTNASAFSGLFAFLSGSSFVLIEFLGVSPTMYGVLFAVVIGGFLSGTLLSGRLSGMGSHRVVPLGVGLCLLGGGSMAALALAGVYHVLAVIPSHAIFLAGVGVVMPQTMAGAIAPFPQCAGSASSLFGFIQMTAAALTGAAVGQLHDGTSRTMALTIAAAGLGALASYVFLVLPARRAAERSVHT